MKKQKISALKKLRQTILRNITINKNIHCIKHHSYPKGSESVVPHLPILL